ncbi:hypothetical protein ADU80_00965 [Clostridium botulinum]|uniref:PI3K/PI4K catalytic domain-containing protein n=2 Tax=Clostridium botulinum TaxID=1491 RepID=A0A9Q1UZ29_CLOBO|nr:hypothetical protein [Clostridium botulinum]AEB77438.1 conserved hypothetical protein [Clostridium botulinum BKT015925]KEH96032.1 hypothetical protein Y848_p0017 [Clostridium botulinum C/D str. Sp77]KEH96979.1 hypothetical protein Z953_13340 [Clostridium botulinum D str. 16868]KOA74136.1 hypothetical protein ADU77_12435 [Clostridium botulinum]KOA83858.1 hypothetical protein ADU75_10060 [Clostridium botulinum]
MSEFYLMNKEIPVLLFSDKLDMNGDYPIKESFHKEKIPYILKHDIGGLKDWFRSRVIPANRNHLEKLIESLDFKEKPTALDYLKLNNGFSLNDSYWIKPLDSKDMYPLDLCWTKYNLYDNKFEESLGLITFFGNNTSLGGTVNTPKVSSPELTTQGVMNKAWRRIENKLLLYKRGNVGAANLDKEHFAEGISSEIGRLLKLNCIPYWTDTWHKQNCSVCDIFTTKNRGYLPVRYFLESIEPNKKKWGFQNVTEWIPKEFRQDFLDMIVFDYIIENRDRHLGNFGFIIDNNTQKILSFAPLFDQGYSLMSNAMEYDFDRDLIEYSESHPSFLLENKILGKYVIEKNKPRYKHWTKILRLNIDNIEWFNCPDWYRKGIKKLILSRCDMIDSI